MLEDLYRYLTRLMQSDSFEYGLAALFILIWWAVSRVVGLVRGERPVETEPRPRRRLPL